jgi:hypothetical protein
MYTFDIQDQDQKEWLEHKFKKSSDFQAFHSKAAQRDHDHTEMLEDIEKLSALLSAAKQKHRVWIKNNHARIYIPGTQAYLTSSGTLVGSVYASQRAKVYAATQEFYAYLDSVCVDREDKRERDYWERVYAWAIAQGYTLITH